MATFLPILSLSSLLNASSSSSSSTSASSSLTWSLFDEALKKHGFAFVYIDAQTEIPGINNNNSNNTVDVNAVIDAAQTELEHFFDLPMTEKIKTTTPSISTSTTTSTSTALFNTLSDADTVNKASPSVSFNQEPGYGFHKDPDKEGLRLLTGSRFSVSWLPSFSTSTSSPSSFSFSPVLSLTNCLHSLLRQLCLLSCARLPCIGVTATELATVHSVPLVNQDEKQAFAMLDVVHYVNNSDNDSNDNNSQILCAAHTDPGFLSLHVYESHHAGLQMFDRVQQRWITTHDVRATTATTATTTTATPATTRIGVLWAGQLMSIVSKNVYQAGLHRVVKNNNNNNDNNNNNNSNNNNNNSSNSNNSNTLNKKKKKNSSNNIFNNSAPRKGRLSFWIEAVTSSQDISVFAPLLNANINSNSVPFTFTIPLDAISSSKNSTSSSTSFSSSSSSSSSSSLSIANSNNNNTGDKPAVRPAARGADMSAAVAEVVVEPGETVLRALQRASRRLGMPMTKIIRYYCPICGNTASNLEQHFKETHPNGIRFKGREPPAANSQAQ